MNFELVYTSAARGILTGSKGYCSVAFTEGMPANYVRLAESLSGYVPVERNPTAFSHYRLLLGGQRLSVLSRVTQTDYADYTGRKPIIAHHVVMERNSPMEQGSPAHAMLSSGFFITEWHDEPRLIKQTKRMPVDDITRFYAEQWKKTCGDAGWAGMLAHYFHESPDKPVFIIFEPGQDLLPLLGEALALLPPDVRWNVTFSTYFTALPKDNVTCIWRCCLADSPALKEMRRTAGALSIDLTKARARKPDSNPFVECAREGKQPEWPKRATEFHVPAPPPKPVEPTAELVAQPEAAVPRGEQSTRSPAKPSAPPRGPTPLYPMPEQRKMWPKILTAGVAVVVGAILGAGVILWFLKPGSRVTRPLPVAPSNQVQTQQQVETKPPQPHKVETPAAQPTVTPPPPPPEVAIAKPTVKEPPKPDPAPSPPSPPKAPLEPEWLVRLVELKKTPANWWITLPDDDPQWSEHKYKFYYTDTNKEISAVEARSGGALGGKVQEIVFTMEYCKIKASVSNKEIKFIPIDGSKQSPQFPYFMRVERGNGKQDQLIWLRTLVLSNVGVTDSADGFQMSFSQQNVQFLLNSSHKTNLMCRVTFQNITEPTNIVFTATLKGEGITVSLPFSAEEKKNLRKRIAQPILDEKYANRKAALKKESYKVSNLEALISMYLPATVKPDGEEVRKCCKALANRIIEEKRKTLKPQEENLETMEKNLKENEAKHKQSSAEAAEERLLKAQLTTIIKDRDVKQQKLDELLSELKRKRETLKKLQQPEKDLQGFDKHYALPKADKNELNNKKKKLERDANTNKPKIEDLEREIDQIKNKIQPQRVPLEANIKELNSKKEQIENQLKGIADLPSLWNVIENQKDHVRKYTTQLEAPRKKIAELEALLNGGDLRGFFAATLSTAGNTLTSDELKQVCESDQINKLLRQPFPDEMDKISKEVSLMPVRVAFSTRAEPSQELLVVEPPADGVGMSILGPGVR